MSDQIIQILADSFLDPPGHTEMQPAHGRTLSDPENYLIIIIIGRQVSKVIRYWYRTGYLLINAVLWNRSRIRNRKFLPQRNRNRKIPVPEPTLGPDPI